VVTIAFAGTYLHDRAWACLKHGHRFRLATVVEYLCHAHFAGEKTQRHGWFLSKKIGNPTDHCSSPRLADIMDGRELKPIAGGQNVIS
jgi:hypothetical protein